MKLALLLLMAALPLVLMAQPAPVEHWNRQYGGVGWERPLAIRATPDGGTIQVGDYTQIINSQTDMIVLKQAADGTPEWVRHYGDGIKMETAFDILCMRDGGYTIVGFTGVGTEGSMDDLGNSYVCALPRSAKRCGRAATISAGLTTCMARWK